MRCDTAFAVSLEDACRRKRAVFAGTDNLRKREGEDLPVRLGRRRVVDSGKGGELCTELLLLSETVIERASASV